MGHPHLRVVENMNSIGRREDADITDRFNVGIWAAPRAFGYQGDHAGVGLATALQRGTSWQGGFGIARLSADGVYGGAGLDSGRVIGEATAAQFASPRQSLLLHAEAGALRNESPGGEFDLWTYNNGPRLYSAHTFTGNRMLWGSMEDRFAVREDFSASSTSGSRRSRTLEVRGTTTKRRGWPLTSACHCASASRAARAGTSWSMQWDIATATGTSDAAGRSRSAARSSISARVRAGPAARRTPTVRHSRHADDDVRRRNHARHSRRAHGHCRRRARARAVHGRRGDRDGVHNRTVPPPASPTTRGGARSGRASPLPQVSTDDAWPSVTVQVPMYNERYVATDAIDACASLEYPRDRFELQIVDDSTDDTRELIDQRAQYWRERGVCVTVVRRADRSGFKAGARRSRLRPPGRFIAIFDADFRPNPDFLLFFA